MISSSATRASRALLGSASRRSMSTAAEHKPKIDLYGIHARYANAAYIAASKASILDTVETELLAIRKTAAESPKFGDYLKNPTIARDKKAAAMKEMLEEKMSPVTVNLMTALAGNARLAETDKVVGAYLELMKANRGEVEATITSAEPLTKAQADAVTAAMKGQVAEGKKVVLSTTVDPSILGGLQVQIGDQFLDLSVSGKIASMSRNLV